jgi:hypothetical protein
MNRQSRNRQFLSTLLGLSLRAAVSVPAMAQDEDRETKQTGAMSQKVYELLTEVQEFVEVEDYNSAQLRLNDLKADENMSPYERAQTWN